MKLERFFGIPPTLPQAVRSNFIHMYFDITWWGVYTGATVAFLTIYAARIGATAAQIGLLTALPAAVTLGLSLPAGRLVKGHSARTASVLSTFTARILFLVYSFLPWLLSTRLQVQAILWLAVLQAIPNTVVAISFNHNFMDIIPSEWRATVVGTRYAILAFVSFFVTLACGQLLTHLPFPTGYQVVFFVGFSGAILTVYHISRTRPVPDPNPLVADLITAEANRPSTSRRWWQLPSQDARVRSYLKVLGLLFLFNAGNSMVAPLIPNLLVHKLDLSDAMISIGTAVTSMLMFASSLFIARIIRRTSNRWATGMGVCLLSFQAFFLALAQDAALYLASAAITGVATGFLGSAAFNYTIENIPQESRSTWLSWNVLLANLAVLLGALAGPALARVGGAPAALAVFGVLRLAVGVVILRWG